MAFEAPTPPEICSDEDDFCLPGLELQHELLLTLRDWESAAVIVQRLSEAGAELHALSVNPQADGFILKCRVKAISATRARAFVADLGAFVSGAACVEHLMLAKAPDHARA
ncbi:hypothetical protein [Candidatus Viadribacter manganicus]|uniref:Uncharacterized protein n=1 Tax=Candidatus Viadribacter manganicus TaxID=1759059 RepID=A0A1B1AHK0_9PROT|nr:hypothetical protein [Candidatus Viadribacter manganicus]ANP46046.1 hypothetical protein ATE48_08990 [Candidatus Viadribacter manganicus]